MPRLALLKTARGLDPGPSAIEVDTGKVEVAVVESGFETWDFGTEPARDIAVCVNRDADLALLYDSMYLDRPKRVGTNANMHLRIHLIVQLRFGSRIGCAGGGGRTWQNGWCRVKHLVCLRQRGNHT